MYSCENIAQRRSWYQVEKHKILPFSPAVLGADGAGATLKSNPGIPAVCLRDGFVVRIDPAACSARGLVDGDLGRGMEAGNVVRGGEASQATAEDGNVLGRR